MVIAYRRQPVTYLPGEYEDVIGVDHVFPFRVCDVTIIVHGDPRVNTQGVAFVPRWKCLLSQVNVELMGWYSMGMPSPPAVQTKSSRADEVIASLLAQGKRPNEIAKLIHPEDKVARKKLRMKLWHRVRHDAMLASAVGHEAQAEMLLGLGPATKALTRRAAKGRPDAIKLLYEASGFHNPKVKHEHSGDIKIELSMPRPERVETVDANDDDVIDAEVVEE